MVVSLVRRKSPHDAPDRTLLSYLRFVTILVVCRHIRRMRRYFFHPSRIPLLHRDRCHWDILFRVTVLNVSINHSETSQGQQDSRGSIGESVSVQSHFIPLRYLEEHMEIV